MMLSTILLLLSLSLGSLMQGLCGSCYKQSVQLSLETSHISPNLSSPLQTELFMNVFSFSSLLTTPEDLSDGCCSSLGLMVVCLLHKAHMLNRLTCFGWPELHKPGIEFLQLHVEINLYVALVSAKREFQLRLVKLNNQCSLLPLAFPPPPSPNGKKKKKKEQKHCNFCSDWARLCKSFICKWFLATAWTVYRLAKDSWRAV